MEFFPRYVSLLFLLLLVPSFVRCDTMSNFISAMLDPAVYDKRERPVPERGGATEVDLDLFISSISDISEVNMEFSINMFFRQRWQDPRLTFPNTTQFNSTLTLSYHFVAMLWLPDVFLKNEKNAAQFHDVPVPNVLLSVSPVGSIIYSQRISTRLSCNMDLRKYPLDSQICDIMFESYGYNNNDILLRWSETLPVHVETDLELAEYNLSKFKTGICTSNYVTGTFSCLYVQIFLERLLEYYLIQIYIPSMLLVTLSWVSFWIDIHAVPARVTLGLLTVLTITTQQSGISAKLPRVSYIKAIDVWMFTCMTFVFSALVEYSAVNVLARRQKMWMDSIKRAWSSGNRNQAYGLPILNLAIGTALKQSYQNLEPQKDDTTRDTKTSENEQNGHVIQNPELKHRHQNGNTTHLKPPNQPPNDPSNRRASRQSSIFDPVMDQKSSYAEKLRRSKALLVDVVSRVVFPTLFVIFNISYWFYYSR